MKLKIGSSKLISLKHQFLAQIIDEIALIFWGYFKIRIAFLN